MQKSIYYVQTNASKDQTKYSIQRKHANIPGSQHKLVFM